MDGCWGAELRQAGWDAVVLVGRADRPVYVSVRNDAVEVRDAGGLRGATHSETQDLIRSELDSPDARVACIGPAGERREACATILHDLGGSTGDAGSGAALGSRNCKAIAVRGTRGVPIAALSRFLELCFAAHESLHACRCDAKVRPSVPQEAPRGWEVRRAACAGCPVSCLAAFRVRGQGSAVLPSDACAELLPEVRRREPAAWYAFVRLCRQEGVDPGAVVAVARQTQGETLTRTSPSLAAAAGILGWPREGDGPGHVTTVGREASVPAAHGDPVDGTAAVVDGLVGGCERLAGGTSGPSRLRSYAAALAAGLGRAVDGDQLARAAAQTVRLEGVLLWNAAAGRAPGRLRAHAEARRGSAAAPTGGVPVAR